MTLYLSLSKGVQFDLGDSHVPGPGDGGPLQHGVGGGAHRAPPPARARRVVHQSPEPVPLLCPAEAAPGLAPAVLGEGEVDGLE